MTLDPKLTDTHILALTLYGECQFPTKHDKDRPSLDVMLALGCLIRNQVRAGESYAAICGLCSCWSASRPKVQAKVLEMREALLAGPVTDPLYTEAAWVAIGIVNGYCRDLIKGATKAHAVGDERPAWAQKRIPTLTFARHSFYAETA